MNLLNKKGLVIRPPGRLTAAQTRLVMARQVADHKAFFI